MVQFQTVLLDPDKLLREGLRRLLDGSDVATVGEASTFDEASHVLRDQGGDLLLVDFCAHSEKDFEFLRQIRTEHEGLKIVVLTNRISGALLAKALDAGADGYLLKDDLSCETLVQSLRLVMLGEKVLPTRLAGMIRDIPMAEKGTPVAANGASLSQRETDVLRRLVHGHSNKIIARDLGITDATVKVHLKSSLRKIDASNRTQAAIWALQHGLGPADGGERSETSPPPPPRWNTGTDNKDQR